MWVHGCLVGCQRDSVLDGRVPDLSVSEKFWLLGNRQIVKDEAAGFSGRWLEESVVES